MIPTDVRNIVIIRGNLMFSLLSAPFRDHQVAQQVAQRAELTPYNHWIRKQYNPNSKLPNALFTCLSGVLLLVCLFIIIIIIICFGRLFAFVVDATQQKQTKLKTFYNTLKHFTTHLQRRTTSQVRTRSSIPISHSWDRAYSQSLAGLRAQRSAGGFSDLWSYLDLQFGFNGLGFGLKGVGWQFRVWGLGFVTKRYKMTFCCVFVLI